MEEILKYITSLGTFGVLAALVGYIFWKHIPNMISEFKTALTEQRADFKDMCTKQQESFEKVISDHRGDHEKQMTRLTDNFEKLKDSEDAQTQSMEKLTTALNNQNSTIIQALIKKV